MNPTMFRLHVFLRDPLPSNKESHVRYVLIETPCRTPKHLNSRIASSYIGSVNTPGNPSSISDDHVNSAYLLEWRSRVSTTNVPSDSGYLTSTHQEAVSYLMNQIR